jgi:WD40 repeat protein
MILQELRRGSEHAIINSLAFDPLGYWLICSSDTATVHIFCLKQTEQEKKFFFAYKTKYYSKMKFYSKIEII